MGYAQFRVILNQVNQIKAKCVCLAVLVQVLVLKYVAILNYRVKIDALTAKQNRLTILILKFTQVRYMLPITELHRCCLASISID